MRDLTHTSAARWHGGCPARYHQQLSSCKFTWAWDVTPPADTSYEHPRMPMTSLTVAPFDPRLDFGCRVHGLDSLRQISDDDVAVLAEAFQAHSLVLLPRQRGLEPALELDLYRRLHRRLWPATPAAAGPRTPSGRDAHPPGFPEVAVIGRGTVRADEGRAARPCAPPRSVFLFCIQRCDTWDLYEWPPTTHLWHDRRS